MFYPVDIEPDGSGFCVSFPDIPEANTSGATMEEALVMAQDALITSMEFYFEDKRAVPPPSKPRKGQPVIELPPSIAAKVLLLNAMIEEKVKPAELARRLGASPQDVNRLVKLTHATKIDSVDQALRAMGRRLELRCGPAG